MQPQLLNREDVESFSGDSSFSRWRTFQEHVDMAGELPACYELAVGQTPTKLAAVVYAGATLEEQQRGKDYARGGSHKKALFEEAKAAGLNIYIRTRKFASRQEAFLFERRLLKSFDYAWNKKDQANPNVRSLEKVLGNAGAYKKKYVELHKPTKEDIEEVARENDGRRNADQKLNYEKRLQRAVENEASLDGLKPRFLVFKEGQEYNASKLLREQLDMRNKLNKLYVARMEKVAPAKLEAQTVSENYGNIARNAPGPLKADKTPDMRYKANRKVAKSKELQSKVKNLEKKLSGPTKKDGTPDRRYAANRATASTASAASAGPTKRDGTPDMRYAANRSTPAPTPTVSRSSGPTKRDGTPDMRYSVNRSSSSYGGGGGGGRGPLTKSGRPDMRYKANR